MNTTFRVETPKRTDHNEGNGQYVSGRYLLRVHDAIYQTSEYIASEMEWLRALREDTDLAVPEPVPNVHGTFMTEAYATDVSEPRVCSLLRWMNGRAYRHASPNRLTAIGEVMAQLHNHAEGWRPPPGFTRRRLDWDGLLGDESGFDVSPERVWKSQPDSYVELFETVSEKIKAAIRELGDGPEVFGLIHADLHTSNLLFYGNETRVIDFDDSGFGYWVYDMAVSLLQNGRPDLRDHFFQGYARHRPIPVDQLKYVDTFTAARRLSNAVWAFGQAEHSSHSRKHTSRWLESTVQALKLFLQQN